MTTFEAAYRADDNHWWYSQSGDCQNAYDAALDELDELRAAIARVRRALDDELANLADDGARLSHSVVRRIEAALAPQKDDQRELGPDR